MFVSQPPAVGLKEYFLKTCLSGRFNGILNGGIQTSYTSTCRSDTDFQRLWIGKKSIIGLRGNVWDGRRWLVSTVLNIGQSRYAVGG